MAAGAFAHRLLDQEQIQTGGLVLLALAATWAYHDLREKIGISALVSEKEKDALSFDGEPIVPKHERPEGIPREGVDVFPEDHLLFQDFAGFADRLNRSWEGEAERWRLQEQRKSSFLLGGQIRYGRSYAIFCNTQKMGYVRVAAGLDYSSENPVVLMSVWMANARLLSPDALTEFFSNLSHWICSTREQVAENDSCVLRAMVHSMWEVGPLASQHSEMEVMLYGTAPIDRY